MLSAAFFVLEKIENFSSEDAAKNIAKKIKNFIYREATIHNPEGDTLPDGIDDEILGKIKEKLK